MTRITLQLARSAMLRAGTLFWEWALDTLQQRDGLTVLANDTTFVSIVAPSLREAQTYASPRLPGCQPAAPRPTAPPVQVGVCASAEGLVVWARLDHAAITGCKVIRLHPGTGPRMQHMPARLQHRASYVVVLFSWHLCLALHMA